MADVFISYARSTEVVADRIANAVRAAGYSVWRDDELPAHRAYAEVIEERLAAARAVIVIWSADAVKSEWVQAEAERARSQRKLIQLRIDDAALPIPFDRIQCADLRGWSGRPDALGLDKVLKSVAELVGVSHEMSGAGPAASPAPSAPAKRRGVILATIGAAALALAVAGGVVWSLHAAGKPVAASVALDAFRPVGPDVPAYVPAAMDQALRDAFGRDNAVVVKDKNVDYVLRGTVERVAEKLHYSIRLESVGDGAALWTTTVDRPGDNPVAVRRVAGMTTWVIRCGLSRAAEYPRRLSPHTLGVYLTFCDTWSGSGTLQHAIDLAKATVAEAPDFSRGWSGLAVSEAQAAWSAAPAEAVALRAQASKDATEALRHDRRNAEAYMAQAFLTTDLARQDAAYEQAMAARPSDCGCEAESYGRFLRSAGRFADANRQTQHALDLLPQAPGTLREMLQGYLLVGDAVHANDILTRTATLYLPEDSTPLAMRHVKALWSGDWTEAARTIPRRATPEFRAGLEAAFAALASRNAGQMAAATARLQALIPGADGDPELTEVLAALGAHDAALSALEAEIGKNDELPPASLFYPPLAPLRSDPRYVKVLERTGLIAYWRTAHTAPDLCHAANPPGWCAGLS